MQIVIVHLSDIHFKSGNDNIASQQATKIVDAIRPLAEDAKACFIVVTGDIAFSGKTSEYDIAYAFLHELLNGIKSHCDKVVSKIILVPGNHDCDFSKEDAARRYLLDNEKIIESFSPDDDSIVRTVLGVQDDFFGFLEIMETVNDDTSKLLQGYERLYYERTFVIEDRIVRFNCYNSAWMSSLHEQQARLSFPINMINNNSDSCDLAIALFHHPSLWLESNISREFRTHIEQTADIILTGHEHIPSQYVKITPDGRANEYVEGAPLQGGSPNQSGFNVIAINLEGEQKKITEYAWEKDLYVPKTEYDWMPLKRNKILRTAQFENNTAFKKRLLNPGASFTHPSGKEIILQDLFVYPELDNFPQDKRPGDTTKERIKSKKVLQYILDNPYLMITGSDLCGRTSLAYMIYSKFLDTENIPILLDGRDIKKASGEGLAKQIERAYFSQYNKENVERFRQLSKEHKVLIIDDFHLSPLNKRGRSVFLQEARHRFERVIVLADDVYRFEEIIAETEERNILYSFSQAEIREFGYELRYKLVHNWFTIGYEYLGSDEELEHKISTAYKVIETLRGHNLVPARPIFILSMLQNLEANIGHNTGQSAYAYFYEVFILQSLAANRRASILMDVIVSYVSHVAYQMFQKRHKFLDSAELEDITDKYCEDYAISFSRETMREILENSHVLCKHVDGTYRFKYKYAYYYFVAKYIADNLRTTSHAEDLLELISRLARTLYVEDNANVILFLVYLTKDENTIREILSQAQNLYTEYYPCDLNSDIAFLNSLQIKPLELSLANGDVRANREEHYRRMDDINGVLEDAVEGSEDSYQQQEDDLMQLNVSFKTLQIMGQILRNFPGTLDRGLKLEIAQSSYHLGLRTMKMILQTFEDNLDDIRGDLADLIREREGIDDEGKLAESVNHFLYVVIMAIAFAFIKRISIDVGSEHLEKTYRQVLEESGGTISIALINTSIKLEYFKVFPKAEILDLYEFLDKNFFAKTILRKLVLDRFRLYNANYKLRQEVCTALGIGLREPLMIERGSLA